MSEPRKNHLNIDGGQVKEDDNIGTYKPVSESDTGFRTSKISLSKSKEKVSDEAEEKLLKKENEIKITPRVDMDAKYVVESYTNGDAKIELDANKRQFSGLTKEELLKYADDPFWVRLRWFLFVLFWALWLGMLVGAIVIIVYAPKCPAPRPKTWFERGPLVDFANTEYSEIEGYLPLLHSAQVQGVFASACQETYVEVPSCLLQFKDFVLKAKDKGIKVIVDLTANFVSKTHAWFVASMNKTAPYEDYFIWAPGTKDENGNTSAPNNWLSTQNESAWTWSETRQAYYLHQYKADQPDLNFTNTKVIEEFDKVIKSWMEAGADGVRLLKARQLVVSNDISLNEEVDPASSKVPGVGHKDYAYLKHDHTSDQPGMDVLLKRWSKLVDNSTTSSGSGESVFTILEEGFPHGELVVIGHQVPELRPAAARALPLDRHPLQLAKDIRSKVQNWTTLQLLAPEELEREVVALALLLPATPVLSVHQLHTEDNSSIVSEPLSRLGSLRRDYAVEHGGHSVLALPAPDNNTMVLAVNRWTQGHTAYVCLLNPGAAPAAADLTPLTEVPDSLALYYRTNYTERAVYERHNVTVPPRSAIVLSYVPRKSDTDS